jgi:uncharacterized protein YqeY
MTLADRLQSDLKDAMRAHDELRRDTLRMVLSAVQNQEKQARRPLTDDEFVVVLTREVKTRRESIDAYQKADRQDLADKERAEVAIISVYLPEPLSQAELRAMVRAAIAESGATSARDLGKVMGLLAPRTRGRADGREVSAMVGQELAAADLATHDVAGHAPNGGRPAG